MMKNFITALPVATIAILLAISCKGRQPKDNITLFEPQALVVYDEEISDSYYSGPYKIARFFGWENGQLEDGSLPDIPGMVYRTGIGRHIGLRCPDERACLDWTSDRIRRFADWCKNGPASTIPETTPLYRNAKSDQDICEHYISEIVDPSAIRSQPSDSSTYLEQFATLLIDIYHSDRYITMQEYTWYDCGSMGDNTALSWFTIDRRTGHQLSLYDIIDESKSQEFAYTMIRHLVNAAGMPWLDNAGEIRNCDLVDYLKQCDGCALVPEGVVVYYHPYKIGCGAEGQYNALIPYEELKGQSMLLSIID